MSLKQLIGVDFGTSTSVIRVKRYEGNQPVGMERLGSEYVSFEGNSLVPTLIRTFKDGSAPFFGPDAEKDKKKSVLWDNFKMDLESTDPEKREQARKLTADFMEYLGKNYRNQFLSQKAEEEELLSLISFPVKWSEETRQFMLKSASKAGFPNVVGMDEAQAAIGAVIVQNADYFVKSGLLKKGVPVNILMIDMGAGTTDLVLCSYTHGEEPKYEVREVWPKEGGIHFGGSEVDRILKAYFRGLLPEEFADRIMGNKSLSLSAFKAWKEKNLSPALKCGEGVDTFSLFDEFAGLIMGEDEVPEYNLDRRTFEKEAAEYLRGFPVLVNECLAHAKAQGEDIDLVLLTGGHSQWYFIREMLTGKMTRFGTIELPKIKAEPERIISVPRPQETVALGLVYSPMVKQIQVSEPEPEKVKKEKEEPVVELETEKSVQVQELVKEERREKPSNSTLKQQEDTIIELKKSAIHGDRNALFELGKQWEEIDLKTAKDYYAKAAELGHQQAKEWIERVQEKRVLYIERKYAYGACAAKYSFSLNGTCVAKLKCGEHATIPLDNYKGIILLCIRNELVKRQYREIYLEPTSSKVEITMSMKMSMNMSLIYEDMKWLRLNIKGARAIEKKDASSTCIRE